MEWVFLLRDAWNLAWWVPSFVGGTWVMAAGSEGPVLYVYLLAALALQGNSDSSRHLAYYAGLRGCMALLASEGIGIFQNKHFIVDETGSCRTISGKLGTHQMSWL